MLCAPSEFQLARGLINHVDDQIRRLLNQVTGIDRMLQNHNDMNDARTNSKLNPVGYSVQMREHITDRKKLVDALAAAGEQTWDPPAMALPAIDVAPIPVPVVHRKTAVPKVDNDGSIDPNADTEAPKNRTFRAPKVRAPKAEPEPEAVGAEDF